MGLVKNTEFKASYQFKGFGNPTLETLVNTLVEGNTEKETLMFFYVHNVKKIQMETEDSLGESTLATDHQPAVTVLNRAQFANYSKAASEYYVQHANKLKADTGAGTTHPKTSGTHTPLALEGTRARV